jgi:hypothetical protein
LKSIDDHQQWDYMHLTQEIAGAQERGRLQNKKYTNRRNGQCPDALPLAQNYITTASCRFTSNNPGDLDYEEVGSKRRGGRSESVIQSFLCFFFDCSLFSCSKTSVTTTWNARG